MNSDESKLKEEDTNETEFKEGDFQEYKGKTSYPGLDPSILPPTPLAKLLARERNKLVKQRMVELESLLKDNLNVKEYAFLLTILGEDFKDFYLPSLEFVEDVSEYKDKVLPEVKERLNILINTLLSKTVYPSNPKKLREEALYLVSLPYFLTTKRETIEIYKKVLNKNHRFPVDFFRYDHGRKAGIVTRYMYENLIGFKPEEIFIKTKKKDFIEYKLEGMLKSYFNSSAQAVVQNAYPKSKYSYLYKEIKDNPNPEKLKPSGGLAHLVESLDNIFNYDS